jgi:hypothetical protein
VGDGVLWPEVATVAIVSVQLLALSAAALVGWNQVLEARRLREQQSRPFVVIDFDVERAVETYLEVCNLGNSLARDVKFEIMPQLESAVEVSVEKLKMLNEGISTLAPGKRLRTFFDIGFERIQSDLPMSYTAIIRYSDQDRKRSFEEVVDLDLGQFLYLESPTRRDVNERLKEISDRLRKLTWSGGGLLTISRAEADQKNQERVREIEERRRLQAGGDS